MIKKIIIGVVVVALLVFAYLIISEGPSSENVDTTPSSEDVVVESEIQDMEEDSILLDAEMDALTELDFE